MVAAMASRCRSGAPENQRAKPALYSMKRRLMARAVSTTTTQLVPAPINSIAANWAAPASTKTAPATSSTPLRPFVWAAAPMATENGISATSSGATSLTASAAALVFCSSVGRGERSAYFEEVICEVIWMVMTSSSISTARRTWRGSRELLKICP